MLDFYREQRIALVILAGRSKNVKRLHYSLGRSKQFS